MIVTRKIQLIVNGDKEEKDRVYTYLRNAQELYPKMMNMCMSAMYSALMQNDKEALSEIRLHYSHKPGSKKGSPYDIFGIENYPTGLPLAGKIPRLCDEAIQKAKRDGLMYGKVSLPTFKKDIPFPVYKANFSFRHHYENDMDFAEAIKRDRNVDIEMKFTNKISFNVLFGNVNLL